MGTATGLGFGAVLKMCFLCVRNEWGLEALCWSGCLKRHFLGLIISVEK